MRRAQTLMAGQRWAINHYVATSESSGYDGDGAKVQDATSGVTTYYLRSSLLGSAIIEEINGSGQKNVGYVYAGGQMLARQQGDYIAWKHSTPAGTGQFDYNVGGVFGSGSQQRVEFDPLGADVGLAAPQPPDTGGGEGDVGSRHIGGIMDARWADFFNLSSGCTIDGLAASCGMAMGALNSGAAKLLPPGVLTIQVHWDFNNGDLLINGTNQVIGDNGSVSNRNWVKDHGEPKTGPSGLGPNGEFDKGDTISTYTNDGNLGHWDYTLVSAGFDFPQNSFDSEPQGWHAGVTWIKCPPVQFKITAIGPGQAPYKTAINQTPRAAIPDGGVAIKPKNFGVKDVNGNNRNVFLNMSFEVDWSTATPAGSPRGIPTEGPFFPVDKIGPASVRNSPGNQLDVYNYSSTKDAQTATRMAMVRAWIPNNTAGVQCPK
jgi:hypothetical protein